MFGYLHLLQQNPKDAQPQEPEIKPFRVGIVNKDKIIRSNLQKDTFGYWSNDNLWSKKEQRCNPQGMDADRRIYKKNLVDQKGIIVRFVIGRSANRGDSLDKEIERENSQTNDFIILEDQVEAVEENAKKGQSRSSFMLWTIGMLNFMLRSMMMCMSILMPLEDTWLI